MSKETRTVRPFRTAALGAILDGIILRFGKRECAAAGSIVVDDPGEFTRSRGEIIWAQDDEFDEFKRALRAGAAELGIDTSALCLFITASTTYLKRTQEVFRCPLDNLESLERVTLITPHDRPAALRTGFHGAVIDTYLLLLRELDKRALFPWRKGTWLSRAKFRVDVEKGAEMYRLTPLDDARRAQLGISPRAIRYIDLGDTDILAPYGDFAPPRFYVDEECLAQLDARHSSPTGVALQAQLVQDFIAAVLWYSAANDDECDLDAKSWEDIEDSLLGRILRFVAGPGASAEDKKTLLKTLGSNPEQVLARAEHAIDIRKYILTALEDKQ